MDVKAVENFLKKAVSDLKLPLHVATHTMRKTFGFRFFRDAEDKNRALVIVMTVLNHSSPEITLRYIGITVDEIAAVYKKIGERSTSNGTTEQLPCRGEVFRPAAWM
jgi:integrase